MAFLFGIISHQVADISWHSMEGLKDGYLSVLANTAFHGDFGAAHGYGDVADDMIGVFEWNVTSYAYEWYVPVQDLRLIYNDYYGESSNIMTEEVINTCSGMLLIGRLGEQIIGRSLYYYYAKKAPVMLDMLRDYFLGGLDDMSAWTSLVWRQAARALINGTEKCDVPHNALALNCDEDETSIDWVINMMSKNMYHNPADTSYQGWFLPTPGDVEIVTEGRGVRIKLRSGVIEEAINEAEKKITLDLNTRPGDDRASDLDPKYIITTQQGYGTLGKDLKMLDLDDDGAADLIVSAPGLNSECVFIVSDVVNSLSQDNINIIEDVAHQRICQDSDVISRFGTSLSVLDINRDGLLDLAVGHPYSGVESLQYHGGVTVYLGQEDDDGEFSVSENDKIRFICTEQHCGLGEVMETHNGDLYIGAPNAGAGGSQRGAVIVISLSEENQAGDTFYIPDDISWSYTGTQDYEHFGSSIAVSDEAVIIGSPTYRRPASKEENSYSLDDIQAAGKVTIMKVSNNEVSQEIVGGEEFDGLGSSLAVVNLQDLNKTVLVVGQASSDSFGANYTQTGSVVIIDLEDESEEYLTVISGNMEVGRFGKMIIPSWNPSGGILVSAPYAGQGLENYGKVYHFQGKNKNSLK